MSQDNEVRGLESRLLQQLQEHAKRLAVNGRMERRVGFLPVPHGIEHLLTELQVARLREFDWRLSIAFVRSQEREEAVIVVRDDYVDSYGILSNDGIVYYDNGLRLRA